MKYRNMGVKTPPIQYTAIKESDFLKHWNGMITNKNVIEDMLTPAVEAIRDFHWGSQIDVGIILDGLEMNEGPNERVIVISLEVHGRGSVRYMSFLIPLEACLDGYSGVMTFFKSEKERKEEKAKEMGEKRIIHEAGGLKALYEKLKLQFDPPAEATVKTNDICPIHKVSYICCTCQD